MQSRFQDMLRNQRLNPETSRAGLKWEEVEDDQLLSMVSEGVSPAEIAKTLQRTEGSIRTRLIVYAISKMEKDNLSLYQVSELVHLSENDILEYQERKRLRDEKKQQKPSKKRQTLPLQPNRPLNVTNADIYDLLLSMNKSLHTLCTR
jgi:hypothetical protein